MARTTGPLLSESASGTVAKLITHSTWKGRTYAKQRTTPTDPKSLPQQLNRAIVSFCNQAWGPGLTRGKKTLGTAS